MIQAFRFDPNRWTVDQAAAWLHAHGFATAGVVAGLEGEPHQAKCFDLGESIGETHTTSPVTGITAVHVRRRAGQDDAGDLGGDIVPDAIAEAANGELEVTLIQEGRSKNGVNWTGPILEKIAKLSVGRPLQALEFSGTRFRQFFNHMMAETRQLPDQVRSMIPDLFHNTTVAVIREAAVTGTAPHRRVVAKAPLRPGAEGFRWILRQMGKLGQSLPGVSIFLKHGQFKARPDADGIEVTDLFQVNHFDVATQPSAGGAITAVLESMTAEGPTMKLFDILTRLLPQRADDLKAAIAESDRDELTLQGLKDAVPEEVYAEAVAAIKAVAESQPAPANHNGLTPDQVEAAKALEAAEKAVAEAKGKLPPAFLANIKKKKKGDKEEEDPKAAGKKMAESLDPEQITRMATKIAELEARDQAREANTHLATSLAESKLPDPIKAAIREQFSGVLFESAQVDLAIASYTKAMAKAADASTDPLPTYDDPILESLTGGDKAIQEFDKMLNGEQSLFEGIKHAYQLISGDIMARGPAFFAQRNHRKGLAESVDWESNQFFRQLRAAKGHEAALFESINTAGFPLILADRMHKRMAKEYAEVGLDQWRKFATVEKVTDFKTWRIQRFGEYGVLPAVAENGAYTALTTPGEEEVTMQIAKFGGTEQLTWESIKNDDTRRWIQVPKKLARAAAWTLHVDFFDMFANNEAIYDTDTLFHANHANVGPTTILTSAVLRTMINVMRAQTDISAVRKIGAQPKYLLVPTEMVELAHEIIGSPGVGLALQAGATENAGITNPLSAYQLQVLEIPHFSVVDDTFLVADPKTVEGAAVAFLDGRDTPELFVQDLATVGSWFDRDAQTLKVRFLYDKAILDERAFVDNIVA